MDKLTHGQLFAGIGGFGLAAEWAGIENIWANEINSFCCKVLRKNFPNLEIHEKDIREIEAHNLKRVDIISGGVPCQPTSLAGKRKGEKDDRWLWPETIRITGQVKPEFAFFENPSSLLTLDNGKAFERICCQMEDQGYEITPIIVSACFAGAWHKRERVWIVAHSKNKRSRKLSIQQRSKRKICTNPSGADKIITNLDSKRLERENRIKKPIRFNRRNSKINKRQWETEPGVVRMVYGISDRMDRIEGLGNAIVPQVAYEFFNAIKQF